MQQFWKVFCDSNEIQRIEHDFKSAVELPKVLFSSFSWLAKMRVLCFRAFLAVFVLSSGMCHVVTLLSGTVVQSP